MYKRSCLSHFGRMASACQLSQVSGMCASFVTMLVFTAESLRSLPPCMCPGYRNKFGSFGLTTDSQCERGDVCARLSDCLCTSLVYEHTCPSQVRMRVGVTSSWMVHACNINRAGSGDCQTAADKACLCLKGQLNCNSAAHLQF